MKCVHRTAALISVIVFFISSSVFSQQPPAVDKDPHMTGLKELSPEELELIKATHPRVIKVKPNKMGLERMNRERAKKKKGMLSPRAAVEHGKDLEVAVGAPGAEVTGTAEPSAFEVLPDTVDNSTLKYFPPVRSQGSLNSCGQFSGVYYAMTYMLAQARDLDAKLGGDTMRLSPKWTYNVINGGSNVGSWYYQAYNIGMKHGIASWAELPYDSNYRAWSLNPAVWKSSIYRKFQGYGYVANTNTDAGIAQVKQMLVNGYILNFPTYINSWKYKAAGNDPSTTLDDGFVGKSVCYYVGGTDGYHAMTVVGYNDNIWVDINSNGSVDPGEKGAFKIANSWGTGWGQAGFAWMAYDALKNPSAVAGGPSTGRQLGWSPAQAHWVTARASYTPKLLGEFTLNHLKRNQLRVKVGVSETSSTVPTTLWSPSYILTAAGGAYAFNGTTVPVDGTFVFDLSDIAPTASGDKRFYVSVQDTTPGDPATLKSFRVIDLANNSEAVSFDVPKTADYSTVYGSVDYSYFNGNYAPAAFVSATPASGIAPVNVSLSAAGSYDPDGTIASYAWDFGDGVTGSGESVSHAYTAAGEYTARLTVTDNLGAKASASQIISVQPDPNVLNAPSTLSLSSSGRTVTLRWSDRSENETGFYVERGVKSGKSYSYQRIATVGSNVSAYTETVLTPGTYYYRVQAFSSELGKVSAYTNTASVRVR